MADDAQRPLAAHYLTVLRRISAAPGGRLRLTCRVVHRGVIDVLVGAHLIATELDPDADLSDPDDGGDLVAVLTSAGRRALRQCDATDDASV